MKRIQIMIIGSVMMLFTACGGGSKESNENEENAAATIEHEEATSGIAKMIEAPEGARVFFVNLEDGAVISSPVKVIMGAEGIKVQPAGEIIEGTGHHHIIINDGPSQLEAVVGADDTHIHFGKGQEETELELTPGNYTLTLQFADGFHRSYGETMSATINIVVE